MFFKLLFLLKNFSFAIRATNYAKLNMIFNFLNYLFIFYSSKQRKLYNENDRVSA